MTYFYLLAGENLELAEAELQGFLKTRNIDNSDRNGRLVHTEQHPDQLRRLGMTHEVIREIDPEKFRPNGSYAVRAENLTENEFDKEEIESNIGERISGLTNEVDLENPDTVVKVYNTEERLVIGKVVEDINRGLFKERSNEKRPFSSPISMDPILARVLVNLSEVSAGESVLDPFCGTGGVLIEAGLCGTVPKGLDIQEKMVSGTQKNLENYGILNHYIKQGDISEVDDIFDGYDVIITDLPYGNASQEENEAVDKFLELIEDFDGKTVFMYNEDSLEDYEADFEVYIHKSLTRYIFVQ